MCTTQSPRLHDPWVSHIPEQGGPKDTQFSSPAWTSLRDFKPLCRVFLSFYTWWCRHKAHLLWYGCNHHMGWKKNLGGGGMETTAVPRLPEPGSQKPSQHSLLGHCKQNEETDGLWDTLAHLSVSEGYRKIRLWLVNALWNFTGCGGQADLLGNCTQRTLNKLQIRSTPPELLNKPSERKALGRRSGNIWASSRGGAFVLGSRQSPEACILLRLSYVSYI